MALCSKCGKELADDAQFCPSCGTPVNGAAKEKTNVAAGKAKEIGGKIKAAIDKLPFNDLARKYADFSNYAVCVLGVVLLVVVISVITPNKKGRTHMKRVLPFLNIISHQDGHCFDNR